MSKITAVLTSNLLFLCYVSVLAIYTHEKKIEHNLAGFLTGMKSDSKLATHTPVM